MFTALAFLCAGIGVAACLTYEHKRTHLVAYFTVTIAGALGAWVFAFLAPLG